MNAHLRDSHHTDGYPLVSFTRIRCTEAKVKCFIYPKEEVGVQEFGPFRLTKYHKVTTTSISISTFLQLDLCYLLSIIPQDLK